MRRLFANAKFDFIGARRRAYGVTAAVLLPGLLFIALKGFDYSIEFTGGTLVQVRTSQPADVGRIRGALEAQGLRGAEIQTFGSATEYVIRARSAVEGSDADNTQATADAVNLALAASVGEGAYRVERTESVGPKVGAELRSKALLAVLLSFVAVLAYLAYRFEWRFGAAAVAATAHDILATLVFVAVMRLEVSLMIVAAVLSMIGYSLNDTIIIFDRVREDLRKYQKDGFVTVLNRAINETLPRSVLTHGTTLATLLSLAILGGPVIRPFVLTMFFGVFTGTFSSIFIAAPVLLWIETRWPGPNSRGLQGVTPAAAGPGRPARRAQPVA